MRSIYSPIRVGVLLCLSVTFAGCWRAQENEVVVYAALDREFSEPILQAEGKQLGLTVLPVYDVESTKTLGLVNRIMAESDSGGCDLFWNNEILHTLRLKQQRLLRPLAIDDTIREEYPAEFKDAEGYWIGFAARARVFLINRDQMPDPNRWPTRWIDLSDPNRLERRAMAKPTFGTTATQMAVLHAQLGDEGFAQLLVDLAKSVSIVSGNKQVATGVASGEFAWGVTDTDDAIIEVERGANVVMVFPDQETTGALLIPNTLCSPLNAPHSLATDRLVNRLLTPEIEQALAQGPSGQIPMHRSIRNRSRVIATQQQEPRWMKVDWETAAQVWPRTHAQLVDWLHQLDAQ